MPSEICIIELLPESIYHFKEIIIIEQMIMNIFCHKYLIDELKNIIINKYSMKYEDYKNKNIVLIKSNRNKMVMLPHTQIHCEQLIVELEKLNYIYIIPENYDIFYLVLLLLFAKKIIFSTGSILYTNKIFFNEQSHLYYITHKNDLYTCMDGINTQKLTYILYENNIFDELKTNEILKIIDEKMK